MPAPLMAAVEGPRVAGEQGAHAVGEGPGPRPDQEVEVIREERPGVDTHGLTPVALAAEDDFVTLRVSAPSDSRERSAFTHGLTPVVLSGALIDGPGAGLHLASEPGDKIGAIGVLPEDEAKSISNSPIIPQE
jgi:hypothetical protein